MRLSAHKARLLRHGVPWSSIQEMSDDDCEALAGALLTQEIEAAQRALKARSMPQKADTEIVPRGLNMVV